MRHMLLTTLLTLAGTSAVAAVPSHCQANEVAIVDAWMGPTKATDAGWKNTQTGKVVSLCADRAKEPFGRVSYRYGLPGKVEMNVDATPQAPFTIANLSTGPHTGLDVVSFSRGEFSYYLGINAGQASGVELTVFKGAKKIVAHFSGNQDGEDFQLGAAEIDLSGQQARSPVLKMGKLKHSLF
ncbi:hypothetical protein [Chitinibacter sp. ZOR0017]|uniref:hypothetical protein n=1 Tax=Chitinibacter sp. ZOR0017 TaxID=1339254 RepID=UPI000647DC0A|nr:hypothetical protein [Chitinibacter sp. ZOR0017]